MNIHQPTDQEPQPKRLISLLRYAKRWGDQEGDTTLFQVKLPNLQASQMLAKVLAQVLAGESSLDLLALCGDVGAGKTYLTSHLIESLIPDADVRSPTFSLVNDYVYQERTLHHLDFYRFDSIDELESVGFWDFAAPQDFCIVEWLEMYPEAMTPKSVLLELQYEGDVVGRSRKGEGEVVEEGRVAYIYSPKNCREELAQGLFNCDFEIQIIDVTRFLTDSA